jgi:hypothetical protein
MNVRTILALLLMLICQRSYAQSYTIQGSVYDTLNNYELPYASVTLLRGGDSVLQTFTRADDKGAFRLKPAPKGKYVLMVTFPGFADYIDKIDLQADMDLGKVILISRVNLMKEVLVTQNYAAIKMKGDTTEYVADSFKVREGADVEALLKKLPGIQVDKNGQISAQGETVKKILVDGEEFFSDDPAVVTKSLQAKAIDKVQVFDKKSDQAEFTGIDDGEKTKTINLQLKDANKKGYFGKINSSAGPGVGQNYFENQGMINAFKGKRKISAFGIVSNTNEVGLGWEDRDKYGGGGGNTTEVNDDGQMYTYFNSDDEFESWNGSYNGEGFPKVWTGGVHYSNKWKEDKHHLGGNYRYAKQNIEVGGNMLTQYVLPGDSQFFSQQTKDLFSTGQRNRADILYDWKIDSTSSIKFTANSNIANTISRSSYHTETFTGAVNEKSILNENYRTLNSDASSFGLNFRLDYRKKFKKKGRTISAGLTQSYRQTESEGFLTATNSTGIGNVDQKKNNTGDNLSLTSRISYTEPLTKKMFLELNYNLTVNDMEAERITNDKDGSSESYDSLNTTLSSHYKYNFLINTGGTTLRWVYNKVIFSVGGSVSNAAFDQNDLLRDTTRSYSFVNFFPRANFNYKFNKQRGLRFGYNGYTKQPKIDEIQPLADNTDPMNIVVGNPNLTQSFNHNFSAGYNDYKVLTGRYVWANLYYTFTNNDISRTETVDAIGRRIYQYTNIDGNYSGGMWLGYGFKVKKVTLNMNGNIRVSHTNNIVNGITNTSNSNEYTLGPGFNYNSENEKFSVSMSVKGSYHDNTSTISTLSPSYWTGVLETDISYEFPLKIVVGTDADWNVRERTVAFDRNNNVFIWNAYVSKKFLKKETLELRASVFDILNQNLGYNRFAQNNYVTENSYNTIRRYAFLGINWNFTKSPAAAPEGQDIIK